MKTWGRGKFHISLLPDSGKYSHIYEMGNTVYVPSSPINIIPTQILITNRNTKNNLDADYVKRDDTEYIISL